MTPEPTPYDPVWRAAEPYMRSRKNDVHLPLTYHWAARLVDHYADADRDICLLAAMLHDIGWSTIDMGRIIDEGFRSKNFLTSDVRYLHEAEGVRLAREVLEATGWAEEVIAAVCEIIDGHDTRATAHHLNDRIVRDSDKLWRYSVIGLSIAADWFGGTLQSYAAQVEADLPKFETDFGRELAEAELARSKAALMLHLI